MASEVERKLRIAISKLKKKRLSLMVESWDKAGLCSENGGRRMTEIFSKVLFQLFKKNTIPKLRYLLIVPVD